MSKLGPVKVGGMHPIRIMGVLNASPESFYKKSIRKGHQMAHAALLMEREGADFVDIGGMSTAPYLSTLISERQETARVLSAIKQVRKVSDLPISVDTCRAGVAKAALEEDVEILNDISGLKFDPLMVRVAERYSPSLVLCSYSKTPVRGNLLAQTRRLLQQSIRMALSAVGREDITLDPAIGFFRKEGKNPFFTKISGSWLDHDLEVLENISDLKMGYPILVSASNKSFIGSILESKDPTDRLLGSLTAESIAAMNGADVIRTHNVKETKAAISLAQKLSGKIGKGL